MDFKDWSGILGTWVSISAAIVGGSVGLGQYQRDLELRNEELSRRADARVLQTFSLFEQWQSADMLRIRNKVSVAGLDGIEQMVMAGDQEVFAYIDFFDAVQICLERDLCDKDLTAQLLAPYAQGAYSMLSDQINSIRQAECGGGIQLARPAGYGLEALATGAPPALNCAAP